MKLFCKGCGVRVHPKTLMEKWKGVQDESKLPIEFKDCWRCSSCAAKYIDTQKSIEQRMKY